MTGKWLLSLQICWMTGCSLFMTSMGSHWCECSQIEEPNIVVQESITNINSTWRLRISITRRQKPEVHKQAVSVNVFTGQCRKSFMRLHSGRKYTERSRNYKTMWISGWSTITTRDLIQVNIATVNPDANLEWQSASDKREIIGYSESKFCIFDSVGWRENRRWWRATCQKYSDWLEWPRGWKYPLLPPFHSGQRCLRKLKSIN